MLAGCQQLLIYMTRLRASLKNGTLHKNWCLYSKNTFKSALGHAYGQKNEG